MKCTAKCVQRRFFLFSGSAISLRLLRVLNREQPLFRVPSVLSCLENVGWLAYRPGRMSVDYGRGCAGVSPRGGFSKYFLKVA